MEADLVATLKTLCPRVFPDFAAVETAMPYVTFQHIGGPALRNFDNSPMTHRHTAMQINVWALTRAECLLLARQIEEALCAAPAFNARPESEPIGSAEPDFARYGTIQDFTILALR